jgi:putative ATP-binding cassette transporter
LERCRGGLRFTRRAWGLAAPYWRSNERWRARMLLVAIVTLTLGLVGLSILYNDWNRAFFEAIQNKDFESFGPLLLRFCILAGLYIAGAVYRRYLTQMLQMRWRIWLTRHYLDRWMDDHVYYHLEIGEQRPDNPDQRLAEDLRLFAFNTLDLAMGILSSAVTLVSFVAILWVISGPLAVSVGGVPVEIPGYMVWVALLYAVFGSVLTHAVGRPLINLNFQQQRVEADLRFGLIRLRENAEGVALYRGERVERGQLETRLERIRSNWWQLMRYTRNLTFLTVGYSQLASIFPVLVAAPRYFAGAITLGVLTQIGNAFGQVQGSLSWFVESYGSLASWKATVDRLLTFEDAIDQATAHREEVPAITMIADGVGDLRAERLELRMPGGIRILREMDLSIGHGERVLIGGDTGVGKSTLFRALAGIWPFGSGHVHVPKQARVLFLPQRAYLPIVSLRETVTYPEPASAFDDAAIRDVMQATGLGAFVGRLDEVENWSLQMSGGEQQRLAIARALLHQPEWLFMDEATAALDEGAERELYALLAERLPHTAIVSIAHGPAVSSLHTRRMQLTSGGLVATAEHEITYASD